MNLNEPTVAKLQLYGAGWLVVQKISSAQRPYHWPYPICRSCHAELQTEGNTLTCRNPRCKKVDQVIQLEDDLGTTQRLVIQIYEGDQRRKDKMQWLNYDQELRPLAEGSDSDDEHWCTVKFLQTTSGKVLMVLVGKKGTDSKVQFFVKEGLDQVTFDHVGDLNPSELLVAFKAQFSDGTVTETKYPEN